MHSSVVYFSHILLAFGAFASPSFKSLRVDTTVGTVEGFIDTSNPGVAQWLGIPFAEPPVGSLRWVEPVPKAKVHSLIEAKVAPKSCAQYANPNATVFNQIVPEFLASAPFSEDCLYLNVIAPAGPRKKLPVLFWVHGGEIQYGGINTPYEHPQKWVERTQSHIVVMINYRLNIFGFPNAKGLAEKNFGLLDQRLASEWVRANIEAFGGDPERITGWGHSAGGSAVDAHQFAWPNDLIFNSIIIESGVIIMGMTSNDPDQLSFSYIAQQAGCSANLTAEEEVHCLRSVNSHIISTVIMGHVKSGAVPALYFSAHADGKRIFTVSEYMARGMAGQYADVPLLLGTNAQEATSIIPFAEASQLSAGNITLLTETILQCPTAVTSKYRATSGRSTYRYYYAGNFSNISPVPWLGAYHFSELPLIMGTHSDYRGKSTPFQYSLSHKMQDLWLAFAKDPHNGLECHGWTPYASDGKAQVFGKNDVLVQTENIESLDAACNL